MTFFLLHSRLAFNLFFLNLLQSSSRTNKSRVKMARFNWQFPRDEKQRSDDVSNSYNQGILITIKRVLKFLKTLLCRSYTRSLLKFLRLSLLLAFRMANLILFTNNSTRAGYDTRSIFKRSLTGFNSEFSFS